MGLPQEENVHREAWGYSFDWTPEHLTPEQLRPLMFQYDELATQCLDSIDRITASLPAREDGTPGEEKTAEERKTEEKTELDPDSAPAPERARHRPRRDLYQFLVEHHDADPKLSQLWREVHTVPDWVDWEQIDRGQQVFYRYAGPSIVSLTFQSLLGGMASHRVVETLARTGGFGPAVTRRRLLETFQHILDVTRDLASVQPGGKGFASSLRVRLLHAAVRRRILALAAEDPGYYRAAEHGVPISDLDSIATVVSFSANLVWVGFPRQGIHLRPGEAADYLALWRWVAHVLGTPTGAFATPARAKAMMESLLLSEIHPTETGRVLASNIVTGLASQAPTYASADFLRAQAYWLNGAELAAALAVPRPPVYYSVLMAGQCLFFMGLCYARRAVPAWDAAGIARMRRLLHAEVLRQTDMHEALHEFQYIPRRGHTTTELGLADAAGRGRGGGGFWAVETSVERRNLRALLWGVVAVGGALWVGAWGVTCAKTVATAMFQTIRSRTIGRA